MARITAARPDFNGYVAGVKFEDGEAETTDEGAIAYFVGAGYDVSGADGFEIEQSIDRPAAVIGTPLASVPRSPYADAADPRNDMVPVGGVKSDGTIVAGTNKGKKLAADTTPPVSLAEPEEAATPVAAPTAVPEVAPADVPEPTAETNAEAPTPASDSTEAAAPTGSTSSTDASKTDTSSSSTSTSSSSKKASS